MQEFDDDGGVHWVELGYTTTSHLGKKLNDTNSIQWFLAIAARRQDTGDELLNVLRSRRWRIQQAWKVVNKQIEEKTKDDRMSLHATFIAAKG